MKKTTVPALLCPDSGPRAGKKIIVTLFVLCFCLLCAVGASAQPRAAADKPASITTFEAPGACTSGCAGSYSGTNGLSINTAGVIAGNYWDKSGVSHGFVRDAKGKFTTFSAPHAGKGLNEGTGGCYGINAAGTIAANYGDSNNAFHGLVRAANGKLTEFNAPGAGTGSGQGTNPYGINNSGAVAGAVVDSNNVSHGFLRSK